MIQKRACRRKMEAIRLNLLNQWERLGQASIVSEQVRDVDSGALAMEMEMERMMKMVDTLACLLHLRKKRTLYHSNLPLLLRDQVFRLRHCLHDLYRNLGQIEDGRPLVSRTRPMRAADG
jgi:hypothetical protein